MSYGFFRELIQYYVDPVLCNWTVNTRVTNSNFFKPKDSVKTNEKIQRDFVTYTNRVRSLGIDRELKRLLLTAHIEDLACGFWLENGDSNAIFYFPLSWVILTGKTNGNWTYKINSKRISQRDLDKLPKEIASLVRPYQSKSGEESYAEVPFNKQICLKYNDHVNFIAPPFLYCIQLVVDLIKAKQLGMLRNESDLINLIEMLVPSSDQHDDLLFTDPIISQFAEGVKDLVGDASVILPTPMKLSVLQTSKSTASEKNAVKNQMEAYGEETNMPSFGSVDSGAMLKKSIEFAESKVFSLFDQLSCAISLKMKIDGFGINPGYAFDYELLHMTEFNKFEVQDEIMKQANSGGVVKFRREASLGNPPDVVLGQSYLENVVFSDLFSNLTVLPSAHTVSSDTGGRPTNESQGKGLTDAGEQTVEIDGDNKDNRS